MTNEELFALGMAKVKENDHLEAIRIFTFVLQQEPTNANALSHRGISYLNIDKLELSLADMDAAVEHDPEYSFRYQSRGYLKARMKDYAGALADYEKAVELDPNDAIAHNNLALAQEQMGWAKEAKENFDKSDRLSGIKTAEERAEDRKQKETTIEKKPVAKQPEQQNKTGVIKEVFSNKETFKDFVQFIKNGFRIKKDDKSGKG
ncbi:tetratricopeptide repeat protein [Crocinitomicaceae bacterium]|jgi:tetratricopeptide (TPR) repeat protein|nr:tetratricopeptide repeat protein [Crocinitomicaceae bacterium]